MIVLVIVAFTSSIEHTKVKRTEPNVRNDKCKSLFHLFNWVLSPNLIHLSLTCRYNRVYSTLNSAQPQQ